MMGEFLLYGVSTDYDIVQLLAALDLDIIQQPSNYGKMNTIIRYRIPYLIYLFILLYVTVFPLVVF